MALILILVGASFATTPCLAESYLVPVDYDDIQSAIDAASDGDTILVDPGLYVENIDFSGKSLSLRSVDGPESTTIDGRDQTRGDEGCVVLFASAENADAVLDGFTITSGTGVIVESTSGNEVTYGGGIHIDGASPTITNCVITDGTATQGGGVWLRDSEATLSNCQIIENSADFGGGIRILGDDSDVTIEDCTIESNEADWGAGLHSGTILSGDQLSNTTIHLTGTQFVLNSADFSGGALTVLGHATVDDCTFSSNSSDLSGGALWIYGIASFTRCEFTANESDIGAVVHNSALDRTLDFTRCVFATNEALQGGVYAGDSGATTVDFDNCTLASNRADDGGAVFLDDSQEVEHTINITNSIVWDCNDEPILQGDGTLNITYSCIEGGFIGTGNIDDDPLFVDLDNGDYALGGDSPCIDSGDPDLLDDDSTVIDMGALVFLHSEFLRGDINADGRVHALLDVIFFLEWGFSGGIEPPCLDAGDVDDSGAVHPLVDTIYLLDWQFTGGDEPAAPGPDSCGGDPTADDIDCVEPECP